MARLNSEEAAIAHVAQILDTEGSLKGKSFSISGHLGLPRPEIVSIIEKAGGVFHKSPTYNTHYLVTNSDWNDNSTIAPGTSRKLVAARKNGTKIITEKDLYKMIAQNEPGAQKS